MAGFSDLLVLSHEEADGDVEENHHPQALVPAPLASSAHRHRDAADVPSSCFSFDLALSDHYSGSVFPEDEVVSLALDPFDHCPTHPQPGADPFPEPVESPHFEMAEGMSPEELGLRFGLESTPVFEIQEYGGGGGDVDGPDGVVVSDWGSDEFFLGRRSSASESIEFSRARPVDDDGLRVVEFDSDSDSGEQIVAFGAPDPAGGLPLCWDCLHIEDDGRDPNEEFEWEEVEEADSGLEEREIADEEAARELHRGFQEEVDAARNIEWEVLLSVNNLGRNPMDPEEVEFADEGFVYTSDYDVLVGQFTEHDSFLKGTLPAAKSVVENLPCVLLTEVDIANNNTTCAVCKDQIHIKEQVKKLPCSHHYHKECILPWLGLRNTCPLCRFELPTDDLEYEKWKAGNAGNDISLEEARFRYEYEILPEA